MEAGVRMNRTAGLYLRIPEWLGGHDKRTFHALSRLLVVMGRTIKDVRAGLGWPEERKAFLAGGNGRVYIEFIDLEVVRYVIGITQPYNRRCAGLHVE